jgi:hypothetical protein
VLRSSKIIERARQDHLLETFRSQTNSLSSALLDQVRKSWKSYVCTRVNKGVPTNDRVTEGNEETAWPRISELYSNPEWKQECLKRDEKFDMYYSSAVRPTTCPKLHSSTFGKFRDVRMMQLKLSSSDSAKRTLAWSRLIN